MTTPDLLDAPAVFPHPDGGVLSVPSKLPVHVPAHVMKMSVEEWLGLRARP
ncbi:hypothetical protein [Sphaerisporangium perillae]|uniref:hypothetical protein n=1 Tax=Sphaerisporangium perillae TaxID=2935860 RepID=UPI00200D247B|nr:hypothetical protein [Sphaerisporangium perillae]